MKRWIVNARLRTVRAQAFMMIAGIPESPADGEFLYDAPTVADAMAAGQRRRLAEEALGLFAESFATPLYVVTVDRIEANESILVRAAENVQFLFEWLSEHGFDVWREGTGLVVLGRLP